MAPKKSIWRQDGAQHFQLVHRSQRDPLIHDPDASERVLKPFERENVKHKGQSRKDLEESLSPPEIAASASRPNVGQASMYDIFYDDTEYDYMQHLRSIGEGDTNEDTVESFLLPAPTVKPKTGKGKERSFLKDTTLDLPPEALPSTSEVERNYESELSIPSALAGFQPDMDLHLRQVLEALEDEAFVDDEAEDDFFGAIVKSGERGSDDDVDFNFDNENDEASDEAIPSSSAQPLGPLSVPGAVDDNWMERFASFKRQEAAKKSRVAFTESLDEDDLRSEGHDTLGGLPKLPVKGGKRRRTGTSDASGYSLSSSAMFRNEGLSTLDERFTQIELEYDSSDDDGDDSDEDNSRSVGEAQALGDGEAPALLRPREDFSVLLDDFLDKYELVGGKVKPVLEGKTGSEKLGAMRDALLPGVDKAELHIPGERSRILATAELEVHGPDSDDDQDIPLPTIVGIGNQKDRWDVESILSTYTNLDNHPKLIRAGANPITTFTPFASTSSVQIRLDSNTGLPRVVSSGQSSSRSRVRDLGFDGEHNDAIESPRKTITRSKQESKEEKKARKQSVKDERQARRLAKKAMTNSFETERARQQQVQDVKPGGLVRKL